MREVMKTIKKATDPFVSKKPERSLGAPWLSDLVACRRIVALCEKCYRRYDPRIWKRFDYVPNYEWLDRTDCDGCSEFKICATFLPGETPGGTRAIQIQEKNKKCVRIAV